jgi:hypothetical protein
VFIIQYPLNIFLPFLGFLVFLFWIAQSSSKKASAMVEEVPVQWHAQHPPGPGYRPADEERRRPIREVPAGHYSQNPLRPRPPLKVAYNTQTGTFFPMASANLPPVRVTITPSRADRFQLTG